MDLLSSRADIRGPLRRMPYALTLILTALPLLAGCESTRMTGLAGPANPEELRDLATRYVRSAFHFPDHPGVRAQAVEAAEDLGPEWLPMIRGALRDEQPAVRFAACMAIGRLRDQTALPQIREMVKDPDPSVRVGAFFALERMGDASYRPTWAEILKKHENPTVRRNAALALGQLHDRATLPLLHAVSVRDRDEGVRLQAIEGMAYLGDRQAVSHFIRDAYGGIGFKQPFALLTLGKVSDDRVLPTLRSRLGSSPYIEAQLAAARSLGHLGYGEGYDLAISALNWNSPQPGLADDPPENQTMRVRSMAAMALGEIGDPEALPALRARMQTPDDPRVQLAAARAILMILQRPTGTSRPT